MTIDRDVDDDWDDDEVGDDGDDGDDVDDSDDEPTLPCPFCRREILEDSPWCPSCERFISAEDHARLRRPVWVILTALICLGVVIRWLLTAFGSSL